MGTCRYCNQSAGFLRKQHRPCQDLHAQSMREMTQLAAQAAGTAGFSEKALRNTLQTIASRARASTDDISQAIADGWVENALFQYPDCLGLSAAEVNADGAHTSLIQAAVIRDVTMGIIPQRQKVNGTIPFNLMKSETLVWVIEDVDYLEVVTRRERRGTSHGVSIRVAKGLYYRPSTFRSRPIEWEETVHADTGLLGLTTKHVYFAGSRKKFRVRYDRIVSFGPYQDGFGIMRDAQTAKPHTFVIGDDWFAHNLAQTQA